jgi:DNA processing protein
MSISNKNLVLHLSLIPGVGPATITRIFQAASQEPCALYEWRAKDFIHQAKLSEKMAHAVAQGLADRSLLQEELKAIERYQISWVTLYDQEYPSLLKTIYLPPSVLYYQGQPFSTYTPSIAFVGSRKATSYSQSIAEMLIPPLIEQGYTIISGGALGADTLAHRQALTQKGKTVAVIGSGLLRPYPVSNQALFKEIVHEGGAVVSPFPLTMQAIASNFPARNRIIAGISQACVVMQAAAQSGALITAYYALEQGREVCAVPGSIIEPLSAGCNHLLSQGATVVTSGDDILKALGHAVTKPSHANQRDSKPTTQSQEKEMASLSVSEDPILRATQTPTSFDELREITGFSHDELQEKLFNLQLEGIIGQNFMGFWYKI